MSHYPNSGLIENQELEVAFLPIEIKNILYIINPLSIVT